MFSGSEGEGTAVVAVAVVVTGAVVVVAVVAAVVVAGGVGVGSEAGVLQAESRSSAARVIERERIENLRFIGGSFLIGLSDRVYGCAF